MADPQEPRRIPTGPPGTPLPRIWKVDPEPEDEEPTKKKKKKGEDEAKAPPKPKAAPEKKKPAKAKVKTKDGAGKGVLIEETPALDTYQARQTARIITGVAILLFFCLSLFIFYRTFVRSEPVVVDQPGEELAHVPNNSPVPPVNQEPEAQALFERARVIAKNGNPTLAVSLLEKVNRTYPKTKAAAEARAALERPPKNLPLFPESPTVLASAAETVKAPSMPAVAPQVVQAESPGAPDVGDGEARLIAPSNPAEPLPAASTGAPAAATTFTQTKNLPSGFRMRPGSQVHPSGWPLEIVGDRDGAPMVLVPGLSFTMGRDDGESPEVPAHQVTLGTYYIDLHEVTNRQFDLFVKESGPRRERDRAWTKEREKEKDSGTNHGSDSEDAPAVMVSARDAKDFADWAHKVLPTEAQWEAAARTTDGRLFPWGNDPPRGDRASRKSRLVEPIRSFPADVSPYRVYDLAGNAWEWTKDWYDPKYYQQFKTTVADNPTGPPKPKSEQLAVRGSAKNWVVTKREGMKWSTRLPYLGFRCVVQVEGAGNVFEPKPPPGHGGQLPPGNPAGNQGVVPF